MTTVDDFKNYTERNKSAVIEINLSETNIKNDMNLVGRDLDLMRRVDRWDKFDFARFVLLIAGFRGIRYRGFQLVKPHLDIDLSAFHVHGF